jgi:hypothetical protein
MDGKGAMMADQPDVRFLVEQIKQMAALRSDAAGVGASSAKVRSGLASIRADLARVEMKLDAFQEGVEDRFDRLDDLQKSTSRGPTAEKFTGSKDHYAAWRDTQALRPSRIIE